MIGVRNSPTWMRTGTTIATSRYLTFRADNHRPAPSASRTDSAAAKPANGNHTGGTTPQINMAPSATTKPSAKSSKGGNEAEIGTTMRGSDTLAMSSVLETMLVTDR